MKETEFKILTYLNNYVDYNFLDKGLYNCSTPFLFKKTTTIESLIEEAKSIKEITGATFITDEYYRNLKLCTLIEVSIIPTSEFGK